MKKCLIIQTAFIGDALLATAVAASIKAKDPDAKVDYLVRKGLENVLAHCPHIDRILTRDKSLGKLKSLRNLVGQVRAQQYDSVINLHRFFSSGLVAALSGARQKAGYRQNPFAWAFTHKTKHSLDQGLHETERNHSLLCTLGDFPKARPKLVPPAEAYGKVSDYQNKPYITIAPASVWFTKQFPQEQWAGLIKTVAADYQVYLIGGPGDQELCAQLADGKGSKNLAGKLSLLESAALMQGARMNYANDSGPVHLASCVNAPICEVYCSTVPGFGFTPLSDLRHIVETPDTLDCRPCGLHGHKACPEGHFRCATSIATVQLTAALEQGGKKE